MLAPRALGIDSDGREILTYVPGEVVWPDRGDLIESDGAISSVAQWIRKFHDAVSDFDSNGYEWSHRSRDPTCEATGLICHNDLSTWNLIKSPEGWTFIDWDLAAPGRRSWDLAWTLLSLVPFNPKSSLSDERVAHRLRVFCDAYGADLVPPDVVDVARQRSAYEAERIRVLGAAGEPPFDRLLAEGHLEMWSGVERHVSCRGQAWTDLAFGDTSTVSRSAPGLEEPPVR